MGLYGSADCRVKADGLWMEVAGQALGQVSLKSAIFQRLGCVIAMRLRRHSACPEPVDPKFPYSTPFVRRRNTLPGSAPVCSPSTMTTWPLTTTVEIPAEYWCGSS